MHSPSSRGSTAAGRRVSLSLPRIRPPPSLGEFAHPRLMFIRVMEKIDKSGGKLLGAVERVVMVVDCYLVFVEMETKYVKQVMQIRDVTGVDIQAVRIGNMVQKQMLVKSNMGDALIQQTDYATTTQKKSVEELLWVLQRVVYEMFERNIPITEISPDIDLSEAATLRDQSNHRRIFTADWQPIRVARTPSPSPGPPPRNSSPYRMPVNYREGQGGINGNNSVAKSDVESAIARLSQQQQMLHNHLQMMEHQMKRLEPSLPPSEPYRTAAEQHQKTGLQSKWGSAKNVEPRYDLEEARKGADPEGFNDDLGHWTPAGDDQHVTWIQKEFWAHYMNEYERIMSVDRKSTNDSRRAQLRSRVPSPPPTHYYPADDASAKLSRLSDNLSQAKTRLETPTPHSDPPTPWRQYVDTWCDPQNVK